MKTQTARRDQQRERMGEDRRRIIRGANYRESSIEVNGGGEIKSKFLLGEKCGIGIRW